MSIIIGRRKILADVTGFRRIQKWQPSWDTTQLGRNENKTKQSKYSHFGKGYKRTKNLWNSTMWTNLQPKKQALEEYCEPFIEHFWHQYE